MGRCWTPVYMVWTSKFGPGLHVCESDPWNGIWTPLYGVRATHSGVPGFQDRTYPGLNQDLGGGPVPTRVQT
jgi:hypothetical protein